MTFEASRIERRRRKHDISCEAVRKSGRILYAFSTFYLPFYALKPSDIFWHYDPYACISALIYDIDEDVEAGLAHEPRDQRIDEIAEFLRARITFDSEIALVLEESRRYYDFEYDIVRMGGHYTLNDLEEITSIRSFDFRLMHRSLAQLSGVGYRTALFNWFRSFEILMEIDDDISSVEEDSTRCTFNIASLALRASPEAGTEFVMRKREQIERDIHHRMRELSEAEQGLCVSTLTAYRSVVPVPKLDTPSIR